jgi:hypothetical protein
MRYSYYDSERLIKLDLTLARTSWGSNPIRTPWILYTALVRAQCWVFPRTLCSLISGSRVTSQSQGADVTTRIVLVSEDFGVFSDKLNICKSCDKFEMLELEIMAKYFR